MGTIRKVKRKKGIMYRAEACVDGKRTSKTCNTHVEAAIWLDQEEKVLSGEAKRPDDEIGPGDGDMKLCDACERFIKESRIKVSPNQITSYENSQLQIERSFRSKTLLSKISPQDVSSHILKRMHEDNVGVSSIRNELAFIRSLYRHAEQWGVNIPSPELAIKRPRHKKQSREDKLDQVIKPDELKAIFEEVRNRKNNLELYLKFLLYTGMRPSEAALLLWNRLPVKEEKERVKKTMPVGYVDLKRGGFSKIGTKTEVKRFVPAHPVVLDIIKELAESKPSQEKKLVFLDDEKINRVDAYKYYRRSFKTTIDNSVVGGGSLRKDINLYSFRHTFRTKIEECGVSTAIAEQIIGHNDTSFKFTYIHLTDEALIEAMEMLRHDN